MMNFIIFVHPKALLAIIKVEIGQNEPSRIESFRSFFKMAIKSFGMYSRIQI